MRTFSGVTVAALLAIHVGTTTVLACQCGLKPSLDEALEATAVLVIGEVVGVGKIVGIAGEGHVGSVVRVRVERIFKGGPTRELYLLQISNCSYAFTVGNKYLIDAREEAGVRGLVEASRCGRTARLTEAAADISKLESLDVEPPLGAVAAPSP